VEAQKLDYPNPGVEKHPFEVVSIALAKARISEAVFEQNAPVVSSIYKNTIDFLNNLQPFRQPLDTARLSLLTQAHWLWGNYLLQNDKPADAVQHYTSALATAQKMSPMVSATGINRQHFDTHVLGALHLMLGEARLLLGRTDEANTALKAAADIASTPRHALLAGNIALMQGDETEAFLEYGGLKTAPLVGEAMFQIHRLAEGQPANKERLLSLSSRLHDGYLRNHPEVHASELGYWFAVMEKNRFAAQNRYDSAFYWSSSALRHLTTLLDQPTILMSWQDLWLEESLSNAYFLLLGYHNDAKAISEVIRYSREVLDYAKSGNVYYAYMNYYYSNLGHALWLRNEGNDREAAIAAYKEFLKDGGLFTNWELLEKDFRDLHRAGIRWPELRKLVQSIVPEGVQISAESWREMGEKNNR
jgi:hypothetical protein